METILEASHVSYSYHTMQGETPALSNINFTVQRGDFLAVVGPSGCGNAMVLLWKQLTLYFHPYIFNPAISLPDKTTLNNLDCYNIYLN